MINLIEESKEEISEEYNQFSTQEEIQLAALKEQAIILSEEISEYCHLFRDRLRNGQVLSYTDIIAKLYYDIAYANYKYYSQNFVKNNFLSVKIYLEKSIQQFSDEQQIANKINIVKEAKYLLDSVCDLYLRSDIQQNSLPEIPGNAIILVKTRNSNEYISYFVENGLWIIDDGGNLKSIQIQNINLKGIKSGLVIKTKTNTKQIEHITKTAQLQRGRASINVNYYALKRKRKQLEQDLEKKILDARNIKEKENDSRNTETCSTTYRFETLDINNLPSAIVKVISEIIECNLEIGSIDQAEYYIDILRNITGQEFQYKLNEYELRKDLILRLRQIMEFETVLLLPQEDDIEYFIVKKSGNISDYRKEIEEWKKNQCVGDNKSILFIYNLEEEENHWESWFWIPKKVQEIFKLNIYENSILSQFLKHIYSNKTTNLFFSELLDMLGDKNIFVNLNENLKKILFINDQFILKSKRTKIIHSCEFLAKAYEFIGHEPLQERYNRVVDYFLREKNQFLQEFSSSCELNHHSETLLDKKQFPLSLFPLCSGSAIRKLNDRINEKEFFSDILPYIDQIKDLQRSFNFIYNIDWQFCYNQNNKEKFFQKWYIDNNTFNENNPYERKYLFLLIQCDLYFILNFDEKNLPEISGNAIILTKTQERNGYKGYFLKDSIWIKDSRIDGLKNIVVENVRIVENPGLINEEKFIDQESRNEIEKIATEMKLNRWYFYGEVAYGRVSEGFIDQKNELKPLEIYLKNILPNDIKNNNNNKLFSKESRILNHLSEIYKEYSYEIYSSSEQYFLEPMSKIIYDQQISLNKGIRIYDLRKIDHAKDLKTRIQSDRKNNFSCIVKLSHKHYITLFIENEIYNNENYFLRYIYILNSTFEKRILKKLKWFTGVSDQCIYKLNFIRCPKQKLMSEDSLLHAYFNAAACQWACDNNHWEFLKKFFDKQKFSSKENIEKIKQWFIESTENISISKHIEKEAPQQETFKVIEQFKELFVKTISSYLNSIETKQNNNCIEDLEKNFVNIKTFDEIYDCISKISETENHSEIRECINKIKKTRDNTEEIKREHFEVNSIVDIMFATLKEYSLNSLPFQEKLSQYFEIFEDRLHHAILSIMTEKSSLISQEIHPDFATQLNTNFELSDSSRSSSYIEFIEFLENRLSTEKTFSNREELISLCKNIKNVIEDAKTQNVEATDQMVKKSLDIILDFIKNFQEVENSLKEFHRIFKRLLPYRYELLDIPTINKNLKDDIYEHIFYQNQTFDNIEKCINGLLQNIKIDFNVEDVKRKLKNIFDLFNQYIKNKDERVVHYIGTYLRESMMHRIDYYMNSLTTFRHKSLASIELFEKDLHKFLLNSIRESIKNKNTNNQLASQAMCYLNSKNNNYEKKISMYKDVIEIFNSSIPSEVIQSVKLQLENISHSHSVYLQTKIDDLTKMLSRFANIEKLLPNFSQLFRECLNNKYDHLSEQEVFSPNGRIKNEIFNYLKQDKNFNDIKKFIQNFDNTELTKIIQQCEGFVKDNDEKASTEISQCLQQSIIDTVENYTTSLLTYRHNALIAFNHFEKNFHQLLSTYKAIQDTNLRFFMEQKLKELITLSNDMSNDYYNRSLSIYRCILDHLDGEYKECAVVLKEILKENNHTLKPYFKEKVNNIKNILNSYINWYQIESSKKYEYVIFQIKTNSGILSKILNVIESKYPDCFCPNNEIRIINSNKLYIDIDLPKSKYSGINIVLVSPYQELVNNKDKLIIKTDGEDAKNIWENNPAKSGQRKLLFI